MKLLGSAEKDVDSDKNTGNVPKLESVEVVLVHCNLLKNDYQHISKVLFSFVPNTKIWTVKYFITLSNSGEYS